MRRATPAALLLPAGRHRAQVRTIRSMKLGVQSAGCVVNETEDIDLALGDFGPDYPQGSFVAQDGDNAPATQNFKYVGWTTVRRPLRMR